MLSVCHNTLLNILIVMTVESDYTEFYRDLSKQEERMDESTNWGNES